jgi:hypothetical protein
VSVTCNVTALRYAVTLQVCTQLKLTVTWCRNVPRKVSSSYRVCLCVCLCACNKAAFSSKRRNSEGSGASQRLAPPFVYLPRFLRGNWFVSPSIGRCVLGYYGYSRFTCTSQSMSPFHSFNPSGGTMALGSAQPLTEMSTGNSSWGVKTAGAPGWKVTTFACQMSRNCGSFNLVSAFRAGPGIPGP